jgi:nitrate/nitrite transport system permease protein
VTLTTNTSAEQAIDLTEASPPAGPQSAVSTAPPAIVGVPRGAGLLSRAASTAAWGLIGATAFVALWQLAASRSPDLPSPVETMRMLQRLLADPFYDNGPNDKGIGRQLLISLQRVSSGFGMAGAVGIPLGLAMGASRKVWRAVNPLVQVLRPVSPLAWFPIWLTLADNAPHASVMVIFITALWPVVINTAAAASTIPREQDNVARVFQFGRLARLRHVLIPNAIPGIITGLRLSMGIAWMVIVAVEMLSGGSGIGFFVWDSYNTGNLAAVTSAVIVIGVIGMALDASFLRLGNRFALEVR